MAVPTSRPATGTLLALETPALIADRGRVIANADRMRARAAAHGVALRPHLKTLKSADGARIAHGGLAGPVTVSTLREAEYFLERGFADMTYAVCIAPAKFRHAASLVDRGADLKLLLDNPDVATGLGEFAAGRERRVSVMIEIDCGDHRTGLAPDAPQLVETARRIEQAPGLRLHGLLTHGGHSYLCRSTDAMAVVAEEERQSLLEARARIESAGIGVPVLSSGSTPTAVHGRNYEGLAEIRPGVYLAGDLYQAQLATCDLDDIAVTVLASVIAVDRARNRVVIDAGGLALSKDRSTASAPIDYGYGLLARVDGSRYASDLVVTGVSQEHGVVSSQVPLPFDELAPGALVRVLPNHVCMTAASYDRYYVVDGKDPTLVDTWDKVAGW
ncbi:MAG: alanine racemase [Gammaproteobacteria bacterium]|nr:alanine racemase [Gammaproteobacteria bacterium]MDH4253152.1 alanine racemase [Gammaproteobacteria bacterium]MDH5308486.1 alanine racemase [Gammaproteobacteria bacterium]